MHRPAGVTLIALLQMLQATILLVTLLIAIRTYKGGSDISLGWARQLIPVAEVEDVAIVPVVAGIFVVLAVGLLLLREWARLVTVLLAAIPIAQFVIGFVLVALIKPKRLSAGLNANLRVGLLFDVVILWYLLRNDVKKEFRSLL